MIRYIDSKKMGRGKYSWLDSHYHFSFANYYNPKNVQFGVLRVINDDLIAPNTGFDTHPHQNMEIVSYIVDGQITHADSMDNRRTLSRGQVQYMSAGTGIFHSEHNFGKETLRLLQLWIIPDKNGYEPNYGELKFDFEDRIDHWLPMVASVDNKESNAPIRIHADVNIYATYLTKGKTLDFNVAQDRQAYLVLIEGEAKVNEVSLHERDALEITEENINIDAIEDAHVLVVEMKKA